MCDRKPSRFSLPGVLTIAHLSLCYIVVLASARRDSTGVIADAIFWAMFSLACPLYWLVAPRGGFESLPLHIVVLTANSFLIGHGIAGGWRFISQRQFGLRTLFVMTTVVAICLPLPYVTRIYALLFIATVLLTLLCFVRSPK